MFRRVLIANRGEIACRIVRSLRGLGIRSIAIYSKADADAKHVREADEAHLVGDAPAPASYLNVGRILDIARRTRADAIHPGYGFLSEDARFAEAVTSVGLTFIGPSPGVLRLTGDKVAARRAFAQAGFPVLPAAGPFSDAGGAAREAQGLGFPLIVKAVMGGGGIGMGVATSEGELASVVETASSRAARFFTSPEIYLERYLPSCKHIEIQVCMDRSGRGVHLYERECSVQRRHQKVLEETPSQRTEPTTLWTMTEAAIRAMQAIGYEGVGTVECLLSPDGRFYFLEVNARLQVEHPITELTADVDLVELQVLLASGEPLGLEEPPPRHGHAIEFRIYAEDPRTSLPSPGTVTRLHVPQEARCDFGYDEGDTVPMFYDPLIGKLIVSGRHRAEAIETGRAALAELLIEGVKTNIPTHVEILDDPDFIDGSYDTRILERLTPGMHP